MASCIHLQDLVFGASKDGDSINIVAVLIVKNEKIFIAGDGCDGEGTCLVTVNCASDRFTCNIDVVGAFNCWSGSCWHFGDCIDG